MLVFPCCRFPRSYNCQLVDARTKTASHAGTYCSALSARFYDVNIKGCVDVFLVDYTTLLALMRVERIF